MKLLLDIKFLDGCQELTNKGILFTCTLTIGSTLNLSLDTRGKEKKEESITPLARRKQSPSTLKRNALRKKTFLQKKNLEKHADPQLVDSQIQSGDEMKKFKCNQCDNEFKCNSTLEMHISEVHSQMLTCDECDHTANNANNMEQHKVDKHRIEQLDGSDEVALKVQEEKPVVLKMNRFGLPEVTNLHPNVTPPARVSSPDMGIGCNPVRAMFLHRTYWEYTFSKLGFPEEKEQRRIYYIHYPD